MLRTSKADRRQIRALLAVCEGPKVTKELRSWPLTLDEAGRICVHGWDSGMVNLRGKQQILLLPVLAGRIVSTSFQSILRSLTVLIAYSCFEPSSVINCAAKYVCEYKGAERIPPLAVFGAGLDLRDCPNLATIDSLYVEGRLDLRGAKSLVRLPADMLHCYDLVLSDVRWLPRAPFKTCFA